MAKKTKYQIHSKALKQFDAIMDVMQDERLQCLSDRRFYSIAGAQWEGGLNDQFKNKPRFEFNEVHLSVLRIINEYRNNRITVDFIPKEDEYEDLADLCDGLYRSNEDDSCAQEAYDNAFEEACAGGFGAWRLTTEYVDDEDEEDLRQQIRIEPIFDADASVFFDLAAKRQDKSDAKYCFVIHSIPTDDFYEEYGTVPASWDRPVEMTQFDWNTPDVVRVAEYFVIEDVKQIVHLFETLDGEEEIHSQEEFDEDPELDMNLAAIGTRKTGEKSVMRRKVHKYILTGDRILEDCGYCAGKYIPIVPVFGKRWYVDSIERCSGHVRIAKDAQRLYNMSLSKLGELSAYSSIEKPIFTPEQIVGHREYWARDNIENYPFLTINPVLDQNGNLQLAGPVGYTKPPQVNPAMGTLLQISKQGMTDLLGNQQAGEEIQPNISGKAIELIQTRLDQQTYIYIDNMAKAVKRCGEIWLSMAKEVFVEPGRILKIKDREEKSGRVAIMQPMVEKETGKKYIKYDLSDAEMDLTVSVGPSTSSKRAATVRSLTGLMQMTQDPETQTILTAMAMMNMEGEGLSEIRQFFRRKLLRMGVIEPNEQESQELAAEMQNQQPGAEQQYLQAAAAEAAARAEKAKADTIYTVAKTEQTKAETMDTLAGIDTKERQQTMSMIKTLEDIQDRKSQLPASATASREGVF